MFKKIVQPGLLCIFDADHENPLKLWDKKIRDGFIKRTVSEDVKGLVLEMSSKLPLSSYITCPATKQSLGIQFPFLHLIVKLPHTTFFAIDVQILDNKSVRRRFRITTIQSFVHISSFMCKLPLLLESGWNHVTIPLHHFTKDVFGTNYLQTLRLALYPNCLLKKIYFSDKVYANEDLPPEFHIEDIDTSENYRVKYTSMVIQKRKNSLSYYPDLINAKSNKTLCAIHTRIC